MSDEHEQFRGDPQPGCDNTLTGWRARALATDAQLRALRTQVAELTARLDHEHRRTEALVSRDVAADETIRVLEARALAAEARAEKAEAECANYLAALWLCAEETAWVRTHQDAKGCSIFPVAKTDGPPRLLIMCNDTFAWACADCEECEYPRAREVFEIMETEGWPGIVRWVQAQRRARGEDVEPIEPVARRMKTEDELRASLAALERQVATLTTERDEARAERDAMREQRDARPDITREDAREAVRAYEPRAFADASATRRVLIALRAHAEGGER